MNEYCVTFKDKCYFLIKADRFEILDSGYCYFWIDKFIVCTVNWDQLFSIERFVLVDSHQYWINKIWTSEDGFNN